MTRGLSLAASTLSRGIWIAIAVILLVIPALPIPAWLHGPDRGPIWTPHVVSWGIGLAVVIVVGLLAGRLATRLPPLRAPAVRPWIAVAALAAAFAGLAAIAMHSAFARNPQLVDEMAQLLHARMLAAGKLAGTPPEPPEFFLIAHTGITSAGWVSQYPPGGIVPLALGLLLRAEWLVNPLFGGIGVILVFLCARGLFDTRTGVAAAFLFAASAWVLFMSATYMNHLPAAVYALAAWAALWASPPPGRWRLGLCGLFLAACAATRPLDAIAAAVPVGIWLVSTRRPGAAVWIAGGALPLALAWGYLNARLYGSPLTLGYTALYGPEHGLGFHTDPWGLAYTPLTALSNLAVAVRRLHVHAFEWPIPALLPLAVWALAGRPRTAGDLAVGSALLAVPTLYFFYWHSGYYLGPRLYFLAAPLMVIGTARAWWWMWDRARTAPGTPIRWDAAVAAAAGMVLVWGWIGLLPQRWEVYQEGLRSLKLHPERELAAAGVRRALVIIPESWGSRIAVTLWGMGAPPGLVERAMRRLDACDVHQFTLRARERDVGGPALVDSLDAMMAASAAPPPLVPRWPDPTLRLRARDAMPPACELELRRDLNGFTLYGNHAWRNAVGQDRGLVFARDLYEHNPRLFARYPGWEIWRYAPPEGAGNAPPVLTRVRPARAAGT